MLSSIQQASKLYVPSRMQEFNMAFKIYVKATTAQTPIKFVSTDTKLFPQYCSFSIIEIHCSWLADIILIILKSPLISEWVLFLFYFTRSSKEGAASQGRHFQKAVHVILITTKHPSLFKDFIISHSFIISNFLNGIYPTSPFLIMLKTIKYVHIFPECCLK